MLGSLYALVSLLLGGRWVPLTLPSKDLSSHVLELTTMGAKCEKPGAISCRNTTVQDDLCCFNAPGGQFLLAQYWYSSPAAGANDSWTIHGLWPDYCNGTFPSNCAPERELSNVTAVLEQSGQQKLLKSMNKYWPNDRDTNEKLWEHEYNKHGTCISTLKPECFEKSIKDRFPELVTYLSKTIELFQNLPTYEWLKAKGIVPSTTATYTLTQIHEAIAAQTGFNPSVRCPLERPNYLSEIWYHYVVQGPVGTGTFILSPPDGPKDNCSQTGIRYLPKGTFIPAV